MQIIDELNNFIAQTKEAREIKRALAVKMILSGQRYHEIKDLLGVSHSFVSHWKNQLLFFGVDSLKLKYRGTQGYLTSEQKTDIITWLRQQEYVRLSDLQSHMTKKYNITFRSNQSYYNLLHEAGISWKKTQKCNPAKNEELVVKKKKK